MALLPRLHLPGCAQHVVQRGNNREACFYDETDYKAYLVFLKEAAIKHQVAIHAFVLMTNHVHLLVTPTDKHGASGTMQTLGRRYAQSFNYSHRRTGTLWEGHYKSTIVDVDTYLLTVYRYIELNPVRAEMVSHASEYPWSSYQGNAVGKCIELLAPHRLYRRLGTTEEERQVAYRALFPVRMPDHDVTAIREATTKAWVLGSDRFKAHVEAKTGRQFAPSRRIGDRKSIEFWKAKIQLL